MDDQHVLLLLNRGEDASLDYKQEQYVFTKLDVPGGLSGTDAKEYLEEKKSAFLKDVLAMANSWREGSAYILIGVLDNKVSGADVVGFDENRVHDDAAFQEFINNKVNKTIDFKYTCQMYKGQPLGIFEIFKQPRPFYALKDYGCVKKDEVYFRRGSGCKIATILEITQMGEANSKELQKPKLSFTVAHSLATPDKLNVERTILDFKGPIENLPDFDSAQILSSLRNNSDYIRDIAVYTRELMQAIPLSIFLTNESIFSLTVSELHVYASQNGTPLKIHDHSEMLRKPSSTYYGKLRAVQNQSNITIYEGGNPFAIISTGTMLSQRRMTVDDLSILPICSGPLLVKLELYSKELSAPIKFEHTFQVDAVNAVCDSDQLIYDMFMLDHKAE